MNIAISGKVPIRKFPSGTFPPMFLNICFFCYTVLYFCLLMLSSLYINSLDEGCRQLPEIITSAYGMTLKLEPVIVLDQRRRYVTPSFWWLTSCIIYGPETFYKINLHHQVDDVICQLYLSRGVRKRNYCNNLATRLIPLIVSKSAVGETILKTLLPHFLSI